MNKIHRPHWTSGYIAKVDYQEHDRRRRPARLDHALPARPQGQSRIQGIYQAWRAGRCWRSSPPGPFAADHAGPASPLLPELVRCGVSPTAAAELIRQHAADTIRLQIEHLDWLVEKKPGKIAEPAAWLVSAIKTNPSLPKNFESKADRQRKAEAKEAKEREVAEERRKKRERDAREQANRRAIEAYWASLTPEQQAEHDTAAIALADAEDLKLIEPGPMKRIGLSIIRSKHTLRLLRANGTLPSAAE